MAKSATTNVTKEELQKVQHLKAGEVLSEKSIEAIKKLLQAAQEMQNQIRIIIGKRGTQDPMSFLRMQMEAKKELNKLINSLKWGGAEGEKSVYDIFSDLKAHLKKMILIGNKVLELTTAVERKETKHSHFGFKAARQTLSKISDLEKNEKKHIEANVHTLVVINHYFEIANKLMRKANDILYLYGSNPMIMESYGRQDTRYRLQEIHKLEIHLKNASKLLDSLIESLNKMIGFINNFGEYVKKAEKATEQVLSYEERIAIEYEDVLV